MTMSDHQPISICRVLGCRMKERPSLIRRFEAIAAAALMAVSGEFSRAAPVASGASSKKSLEAQAAAQDEPQKPLPPLERASWIWRQANDNGCQVRISFTLDGAPKSASLLITADNGYELYINGSLVGSDIGAGST